MSMLWRKRKARLAALLNVDGDDDAEALALDRILHGQSVIGKTSKTTEIDSLRFSDKDVDIVGTLEYGQFGVIDVVTCKFNGSLYVRKSVEKRFALRTRDQCSPQYERDILLRARRTNAVWAPHLLCAFQTSTHLSLLMDYAEGGTLWDVAESSPHDGKIVETDLTWWIPQIVSAIHWCHSQGFVHRDIKPHNFVLTANAHVLLIDFGSAAPLLPPEPDGSQRVPQQHCFVPCGTCDYISPEILQAHEEALVALEMEDEEHSSQNKKHMDYGRETDWWSMGAMLYEMVYGVAPFFSNDIRHTYLKIMDHYRSLKFDQSVAVSSHLQDLLRRLLTTPELRLGRGNIREIMDHPFFEGIDWPNVREREKPPGLHLPQFTYTTPVAPSVPAPETASMEESYSRPFAFSVFFQSSPMSALASSVHPTTPSQISNRSILREQPTTTFIAQALTIMCLENMFTTPNAKRYPFATPVRPNVQTPFQTLSRTNTVRRTGPRRAVSDREAMKQLVDCVGMSARKKVLESGRKPRILQSLPRSSLKELRFDRSVVVVGDGGGVSYKLESVLHSDDTTCGSGLSSLSGRTGRSNSGSGLIQGLFADLSVSDADSDAPPSPSPSPRPNSAMSRRSQSSTTSSSCLLRVGQGRLRSADGTKRSTSPSATTQEDSSPASTSNSKRTSSSTFSLRHSRRI
ncbi:Serine/threonine-protein kinase MRCK alpha [Grifola frondosa]|uniref:Serine/threonine-protein kinase MRCK alpha n=1 Tax=Grifola frondosa TaxID=5627 RepID=A0A1C7LR77_GRIFR|nr:Serine/threonine-protein kinase MRCK alpha [Grifola frondosa]